MKPSTVGAGLTAEQRQLFNQLLEEEGIELDELNKLGRRPDPDHLPLSFAQQRLWFIDQLMPATAAYNIHSAVRLVGRLDFSALQRSFTEVVRRHEVLRSSFDSSNGNPVQRIAETAAVPLPVIDLTHLPESERRARALDIARQEARQPFDLAAGPLLRATIIKLSHQEHLLLTTMHHIVSDGWSRGLLINEVVALYNAFSAGKPSPLPDLPIQYADYAAWQRGLIEGKALGEHLGYWKQQLEGYSILQLPTDHPRPAVPGMRGRRQRLRLTRELTDSLKALSRREGATLFMTLLAAFDMLLHRYTGQDDVLVGSPITNRDKLQTESVVGLFVNTMPLRVDLGGDPTFSELLARVKEVVLGAYTHQDLPFERLVDELQPERNLSHNPLFEVLFVFQNMPAARQGTQAGRLRAEPLEVESETAKLDLTLEVIEVDHKLEMTFEYRTDLFNDGTIARMTQHYNKLLEGVAGHASRRLSQTHILTEHERRTVLERWNDTRKDYGELRCTHELFEEQAKRRGKEVALSYEGQTLSYYQLNRRANQLAGYLRHLGVGPESAVAVCMERSLEMVVSLLGVMKAGGAYVPLDPAYPAERLSFMLADSGARVVLMQERLRGTIPETGIEVVRVDGEWDEIGGYSGEGQEATVGGDNLAYVIYTSGSTGRPKAAMNTHAGLRNRLLWMQDAYRLTGQDRVLQKTSFSFDVSVWEFFWPLVAGARLVVARPGGHQDSAYLANTIAAESITVMHFVPSMLQAFLEEDTLRNCRSLRQVICSGEALTPELVARFHEKLTARLDNLYGPTEAAIDVTRWSCEKESPVVPIGKPISNMRIYLLDRFHQPVPAGVAAELYIAGVGVGRGYAGRPEMTAERFIPDPYGVEPGGRMYRTGDLARYLEDGNIEYIGRVDNQVKIRGFRIELGEIEQALSEHVSVEKSTVIAREDAPGDKRLVAYLVLGGRALNVSELRSFLKERLPDYMIPAAFVTLNEMPLTPNGKIDRRALPAPDSSRMDLGEIYLAPRTEIEEMLVAIWSHVLGISGIGVRDNFFALGGDSIRSIQVLALAKKRGLSLTLQQVFQHQTITELAAQVGLGDQEHPATLRTGPFDLVTEEDRLKLPDYVEDAYPLTMLQAGMLYYMDLMPASPLYHNVVTWHLEAELNLELLERAVQHSVTTHAVLRTSFDLTNYSEPLQLVHRAAYLTVPVFDLRHLSAGEQDRAIDEFVEGEKGRRFDLARSPLLRLQIHRRSDQTFNLTLTEFHPVFDGWSIHSTLAEIFSRYFSLLNNETPVEQPPISITFRDYVNLERMALASEESRDYWSRKLSDCTVMEMPRPSARPPSIKGPRIRILDAAIPPEVYEGLQSLARATAVPLKSVLLAAHVKVMSTLGGESDVLTGLSTNGRPEELDGERVRGLFLNTLPFRLKLTGGTWADLVRETFENELELLPHRRYPLAAIQKEWGSQQLFETLFNYVHFHVIEDLLKSQRVNVLSSGKKSEETNFTLLAAFQFYPLISQLALQVHCDATRLSDEQMDSIVALYESVLSAMALDPQARHEERSLLSAAEQRRLLSEWNNYDSDYSTPKPIHGLFEEQAKRRGKEVAVSYEGQTLSYDQLNRRANQLARYLRHLGVGPESAVAVCMERSLEMVVSLLGVMKAGGAYVPLDPAYPAERLSFMLADSGARVVLTQERLRGTIPETGIEVVRVDGEWDEIGGYSGEGQEATVGGDNLAYVIYTSGSTGRPKGVMVTHSNVMRLLAATAHWYGFNAEDVWTMFHSFAFDFSVWEIWGALLYGGRLVIVPYLTSRSPEAFYELLRKEQVTVLNQTPSAFLQLIRAEEATGDGAGLALRLVIFGGEALELQSLMPWIDRHGDELPQIINMYGITETTVHVTYRRILKEDLLDRRGSVIGRQIPDLNIYILDRFLQPLPVGAAGEIYVAGAGLARGYMNRAELTAERFIPNPFSNKAGDRLYKTGDKGRYLAGGDIEYLGRVDHQVKVRGFRIEPGEIEAVMSTHPELSRAVVVMREDESGDKRLIGYVVAKEGRHISAGDLRNYLKERLPDYMVPAAFVFMDELPLTSNGKLNRRALPVPDLERTDLAGDFVAPRTTLEEELVSICARVLQVERLGVHDNFFDLGAHSLLITRIFTRIRETMQVDVPLYLLFESPTVAELAEAIARQKPAEQSSCSASRLGVEDLGWSRMPQVDELSDEEVDSLLNQMMLEENSDR